MIRLLHLSDLHFGNHSRFSGRDAGEVGNWFLKTLVDAEPSLPKQRIDVVVVTGDLAEAGKPAEFQQAGKFLQTLAGELGIEHRRFVFCPGNHDISRPACLKAAADQDIEDFDDDELRRRLDAVKLQFFDEFLERFYGEPIAAAAQSLVRGAIVFSFPELPLSIAALNSCEKESHRPEDHVGHLSETQAQALMDHWRAGEVTSWLKVVAVHHNPDVTVPANLDSWKRWIEGQNDLKPHQIAAWQGDMVGFEGYERLRRIAEDCEVQLVLHGHHHAKDQKVWPWKGTGYAHVLSAGSLSLVADELPGTEPTSFRLIDLDPASESLSARAFLWLEGARTAGSVQPGAFKPDPDGDYGKRLDLPAGFERVPDISEEATSAAERSELAGFLRTFRNAFRGAYSRWDLASAGVTQTGGAARPLDVNLDDMYVPLRLGRGYDPTRLDAGSAIGPEDLLRRERPLAIRGAGGSGKTTWMRWTFRRLLELEHAVPLMLVLRDLANHWEGVPPGVEQSLESFLDSWAAAQVGPGWEKGFVQRLLQAEAGPTPVLLVDGWDELGPLGEQTRAKLIGLMSLYSRLRVVVSSRPYGEGRPSHAEGFDTLDLQPLAGGSGDRSEAGEVETLAAGFFQRCYGEDTQARGASTEGFLNALARSPDAQELARTPLLLTMMLLISRSRPLPDKRHDLYESCIDNLLTARTDRKEKEGARLQSDQWRPADTDERKRAAAGLAFGFQSSQNSGSYAWGLSTIVASRHEAMDLLPETWLTAEKRGFLSWLAGPAGLLIDRSDNTFTFVHLSFQEYLSAWHLDATVEGTASRFEVFRRHLASNRWRESLLLWAARIHRQNPERLDDVVEGLVKLEGGISFVGFSFADGLGTAAAFEDWARLFVNRLSKGWQPEFSLLGRTWKSSHQEARWQRLYQEAIDLSPGLTWLEWLRVDQWFQEAGMARELPRPRALTARALIEASHPPSDQFIERGIAAGRLLCTRSPFWPSGRDLGLLNLWPGTRRLTGLRLQSLFTAVDGRWQPEAFVLQDLLRKRNQDADFARDLARRMLNRFDRDVTDALARYLAGEFDRSLNSDIEHETAHDLALDLASDLEDEIAYYADHGFYHDLSHIQHRSFSRRFRFDLACRFENQIALQTAQGWNLDIEEHGWIRDFEIMEFFSWGRVVAPALLREFQGESKSALVRLFSAACKLTNAPADQDPSVFYRALERLGPRSHRLWPALARHLARLCSPRDQQFLESLARDPFQVEEGPLRWGLRFIVRGDVMQHDGSYITLDELCDQVGLPHLPYLEPLPEPLDIDRDAEG